MLMQAKSMHQGDKDSRNDEGSSRTCRNVYGAGKLIAPYRHPVISILCVCTINRCGRTPTQHTNDRACGNAECELVRTRTCRTDRADCDSAFSCETKRRASFIISTYVLTDCWTLLKRANPAFAFARRKLENMQPHFMTTNEWQSETSSGITIVPCCLQMREPARNITLNDPLASFKFQLSGNRAKLIWERNRGMYETDSGIAT